MLSSGWIIPFQSELGFEFGSSPRSSARAAARDDGATAPCDDAHGGAAPAMVAASAVAVSPSQTASASGELHASTVNRRLLRGGQKAQSLCAMPLLTRVRRASSTP